MASRFKEDERNERIIRGLLKLPSNKKCINCNSLGTQYVCTNFWTFICTNCSGIHREFTHRVKSVSMAKFSSQEVAALQEGGNERAKMIFFKEWDQGRHSFPDSSNVERLRTFIRHVYVDRRYAGDRSVNKPPRSVSEDTYEQRRSETLRGGSQSPSYGEPYERRYGERSPGSEQGDCRRSPGEMADDRQRDDKFGKGSQAVRFEERKVLAGAPMTGARSPNNQVSSPTIRPVRDILGDGAPALQVGEPPKSNGSRATEVPPQAERTTSSSNASPPIIRSVAPTPEVKSVSVAATDTNAIATHSLIDLLDFEAPVAATQENSILQQSTVPPVDGENWASFDSVSGQKPNPVTSSNQVDSALAQLYAPASSNAVSNPSSMLTSASTLPNNTDQWPSAQKNESSLFSSATTQSEFPQPIASQSTLHVPGSLSSVAPNSMAHFTASTVQISQPSALSGNEAGAEVPSQSKSVEAKPSERKELSADLFTSSYPMGPGAFPNWQPHSHYGMGYGMHYSAAVMHAAPYSLPQAAPSSLPQAAPSSLYSSKSANPFDLSMEATLAPTSTFPSMAPLQGALSNNDGSQGLLRASSLGPIPQWMPQQQLSNPLATVSGGYMSQVGNNVNQQTYSNAFPMGSQGAGIASNQQLSFGIPGMTQSPTSSYAQQNASNTFAPSSQNPFG